MIATLALLACPDLGSETGDTSVPGEATGVGCVPTGTAAAELAPPFERMDLAQAIAVVPARGSTCPSVFVSGWIAPDPPERPMAFWLREPPVADGAIDDASTALMV